MSGRPRRGKEVGAFPYLLAPADPVPPKRNPCALCPEMTLRPPDASGKYVCGNCRPAPRPVPPGKVGRLCVRCDRQVIKSRKDQGPFLCDRCRRFLETGEHHKPGYKACLASGDEAQRAARVATLADLYGRVEELGSETKAREAGLLTTLEEMTPEVTTDDTATSADAEDGDESGSDGEVAWD